MLPPRECGFSGSLGQRNAGLCSDRASAIGPMAVKEAEMEVFSEVKSPIIVIDNYDSFTYNLCQVGRFLLVQFRLVEIFERFNMTVNGFMSNLFLSID